MSNKTTERKAPDNLITKVFSADVSIDPDDPRSVTAKISTAAVDRDGEVLVPQGCNSKQFQDNPIVYLNHNYWNVPDSIMGQCTALKRDKEAVVAKTLFATRPATHPADKEWLPDTILDLIKQKVIRGFSVGFVANESRPASQRDIETYGAGCRRVISKWTLHEYSVAPLPCNQEAIALAVSKGILSPDRAKSIFGDFEAKADMKPCAKCGKEFELGELSEADGELVCKGCGGQKSESPEESPADPLPERTVVAAVDLATTEDLSEPPPQKIVHYQINLADRTPKDDTNQRIVRAVVANLAKRRGAIYVDN